MIDSRSFEFPCCLLDRGSCREEPLDPHKLEFTPFEMMHLEEESRMSNTPTHYPPTIQHGGDQPGLIRAFCRATPERKPTVRDEILIAVAAGPRITLDGVEQQFYMDAGKGIPVFVLPTLGRRVRVAVRYARRVVAKS
jgi:hypothetical protein